MSDREIHALIVKVRKLERESAYEREDTDTMELVGDAYKDYQATLGYNQTGRNGKEVTL